MNSANHINKPMVKEETVKSSAADIEDEEATVIETGKKEGKKNRKKKNKGGQWGRKRLKIGFINAKQNCVVT